MRRRPGITVAGALATAVLMISASPAPASEPIEDVLTELSHCKAWADEPGGSPTIVGWGGAYCRAVHTTLVGQVCLVYNGVTIASSCNTLQSTTGSDSSPTKGMRCLPGLWQTQVTVAHLQNAETEVVSDPVLFTCLP